MTKRQQVGCWFALIYLFVTTPIGFILAYLLYKHVGATDVMWVLFWINYPLSFALGVASSLIRDVLLSDDK